MELKNMRLYILSLRQRFYRLKEWIFHFRTQHSIQDSVGICLQTNQGAIVYTGDFKFDQNSVSIQSADIGKMAAIGEKGVLCLLSDSTNADKPGYTVSEAVIGQNITDAFMKAKVESLLLHTVPICTVFSKLFMPHISMAVT